MLILTRKTGQGFTIGDNVTITITEISGDKVRVGIDAPREVKILRSELSETVEQNIQAASSASVKALRDKVKLARLGDKIQVNRPAVELSQTDEEAPGNKTDTEK